MAYAEQFDHIIHMNAMTDLRLCCQHDGCLWLFHVCAPYTIPFYVETDIFVIVEIDISQFNY